MVAGEVLGLHYYHHATLDTLFMESGAPGDPPEGNCVLKCQRWFSRCNENPSIDPFKVLGCVLENFMDTELSKYDNAFDNYSDQKDRINRILTKYGLSYKLGGKIYGSNIGITKITLEEIIRSRDFGAIEDEFRRTVEMVESDPASGITAANSMVEALFRTYIEEEGLVLPSKITVKNLWKVISKNLGLDTSKIENQDIIRIITGLTSVIDGMGAFRTHVGSAHGRSPKSYKIESRHARLAINAAYALSIFILEVWDHHKRRLL